MAVRRVRPPQPLAPHGLPGHLVGEPDPQRLIGAHLTPREAHLLGPAGANRTRQALRTASAGNDAEQDLLAQAVLDVAGGTPEEFLAFVRGEHDKLGKVIRDNGIKVD